MYGLETLETRDLGERDGFHLVAYKVADRDAYFEDEECYEEADKVAYRNGQWSYVGVIVKAFLDDVELGEDSIWRVEEGYSPGFVDPEHRPTGVANAFDHTLGGEGCYDMPDGALTEAKETLARMLAARAKADRLARAKRGRWPRRVRVASCW